MTAQITELIDRPDAFEVVRDLIATILIEEIANQMTLATAAGEDPDLWKIRVFAERSNAWEQWINIGEAEDLSPLCNVEFDSTVADVRASNPISRQKHDAIYNLDCFAVGLSADASGAGHTAGDEQAVLNAHRALRLVRSILMAGCYAYLGYRGEVWGRWHQNSVIYRPEFNGQSVQHVVGARLVLRVAFNEFSPQVTGEILEYISTVANRADKPAESLYQLDFDYA